MGGMDIGGVMAVIGQKTGASDALQMDDRESSLNHKSVEALQTLRRCSLSVFLSHIQTHIHIHAQRFWVGVKVRVGIRVNKGSPVHTTSCKYFLRKVNSRKEKLSLS